MTFSSSISAVSKYEWVRSMCWFVLSSAFSSLFCFLFWLHADLGVHPLYSILCSFLFCEDVYCNHFLIFPYLSNSIFSWFCPGIKARPFSLLKLLDSLPPLCSCLSFLSLVVFFRFPWSFLLGWFVPCSSLLSYLFVFFSLSCCFSCLVFILFALIHNDDFFVFVLFLCLLVRLSFFCSGSCT